MSTRSNSTPSLIPGEMHTTSPETPFAKAVAEAVAAEKKGKTISTSRFRAVRPDEEEVDSSRTTMRPESDDSAEVSDLYKELDNLASAEGSVDELRARIRALRNKVGAQDVCATGNWPVVRVERESQH